MRYTKNTKMVFTKKFTFKIQYFDIHKSLDFRY